jgi:hypothetical protein
LANDRLHEKMMEEETSAFFTPAREEIRQPKDVLDRSDDLWLHEYYKNKSSTSRKEVACIVSPVSPVLRVVPSVSWQKREITNAHFLSGNCGGDLVSGNNAADGPKCRRIPTSASGWSDSPVRKRHSLLSFRYVCPEPVLVK